MKKPLCNLAIALSLFGAISHAAGQAQTPAPSNPLIGRWEADIEKSIGVEPLELVFSETGQLFFLSMSLDKTLSGLLFGYSVDTQPNPMHLDLTWLANDRKITAHTIAQLTPEGTLKIQTDETGEGKARPRTFKDEMTLRRVSKESMPKLYAQALSNSEQSKTGEGLFVIGSFIRLAMTQKLQKNEFPTNFMTLGLNSETANYRYQLQSQPNGLKVIGRPKREGLNSYIALLIERTDDRGNSLALAKLCQSFRPSLIAPATPVVPESDHSSFQLFAGIKCASGSEAVAF